MKREAPRWFDWLWRGSDAELGDVLEEYSTGNHRALWLLREALSARRWHHPSLPNRRSSMFSNLWSDIRYSVRGLRHNPAFTGAAVLAIALGIGINTGIFSLLNGLALRDVPAPNSGELVAIYQIMQDAGNRSIHGARSMFSNAEYERYRDGSRTLSGILGYTVEWTATLGGEEPRRVQGSLVTCNFFDVLQLRVSAGPGFTAANCDAANAPPAVVLSHELWRSRFASDPEIAGRTVLLNRETFTVVGVAPEGFRGISILGSDFFAPLATQRLLRADRDFNNDPNLSWLVLVGRRQSGASAEQVRAELAVIASQIDRDHPPRQTTIRVDRATSLPVPEMRSDVIPSGIVIMTAFGLVLLIACANVANLLLARAAARSKEVAVRLSVGSSRWRLIQQMLTESLLIAATGGVLGSALALWSFRGLLVWVMSSIPLELPMVSLDASPDLRVFGFALGLTLVTGVVFGLIPALQASRPDLYAALKSDSAGGGRQRGGWLRGALVGVQVAVCIVLMIAAALLLRGLSAAQSVDPEFRYKGIAVASFDLRGGDAVKAADFHRRLRARVEAIPGIQATAQTRRAPLTPGRGTVMMRLPGEEALREIDFNLVSPEYFSLVEIPIVRGRTFTDAELSDDLRVVVITESTARAHWPDRDPLGQTFLLAFGRDMVVPVEVIGIAKDAYISSLDKLDEDYAYLPSSPRNQSDMELLVRSDREFGAVAAGIRAAVRELDAGMVVDVKPLEANLDFWQAAAGLAASLAGSLGGLALLLASIGVYGVVSYAVSRRMREVGIRMVLGATAGEVRLLVLKQALRPVAIGAAIGVVASAGVSRILESVLFGVSALDAISFVGAAAFLLAVAVLASWLPARRAMRVDPMVTLRYE